MEERKPKSKFWFVATTIVIIVSIMELAVEILIAKAAKNPPKTC